MTKAADDSIFTASNGLKLKLKKVSRMLMVDVGRKIPVPNVPVVYNEDKSRDEANPNDPDYLRDVQSATFERAALVTLSMISVGSEVLELPEGMAGPQDDEWVQVLEGIEIGVPQGNQRLRYGTWLKYIGMPDGDDFDNFIRAIYRFSGITLEADVKSAEESFRDNSQGPANLGSAVKTVA